MGWNHQLIQESYNTPQEHTPGKTLANYERNPFSKPVGKSLGVCSKGVLKQP